MTTKEQVIQAAIDIGLCCKHGGVDGTYIDLIKFYNLAYKAGEKAMQERAAKVCGKLADEALACGDESALLCFEEAEDAIRALKTTGDTNE